MSEQLDGKGPTTPVTFYYDAKNKREKWVRHVTGKLAQDGVCQGVDAPCIDLVTDGLRWIIHPTLGDCCLLGNTDHGCGPLAQNWIGRNNGSYQGKVTVSGFETDQWNVQGFATNKVYWDAAKSLPVKLDQGNCVNVYDTSSFELGDLDSKVFALPSTCDAKTLCANQFPCTLGDALPKDLQRARTKVPRPAFKGNTFIDMTVKLNGFLNTYPKTKNCHLWTASELQQFQLRMLQLRSPELDEVYRTADDNRKLRGDASVHMKQWDLLGNVSSGLEEPVQLMHRDGHCHEAVMWFVHHLSEPMRQQLAKDATLPLLPETAHTCESATSLGHKLLCDEYAQQSKCMQCHGVTKSSPQIVV